MRSKSESVNLRVSEVIDGQSGQSTSVVRLMERNGEVEGLGRKMERGRVGRTEKRAGRIQQVAQGQYVVSDTRCPALSDSELE